MSYSMKARRIRPAQLFMGLLLFLLISAALMITLPGRSYAAVPEIIPGSQYPKDGAVGVPAGVEYIRVSFKSNPQAETTGSAANNYLPIQKYDPGSSVDPNWKKIRVVELSTNTQVQAMNNGEPIVYYDDDNNPSTVNPNSATLLIKVNNYFSSVDKKLKPGETYQVIIPQGSVDYVNDTNQDVNAQISWTFTVERKPVPSLFAFQPGNQTFTLKNGNSDLPNKVDIHGVGYRKSLVIQFQNDIKSNIDKNTVVISGNELSASSTPDTPQTDLALDENSKNTLIVKLKDEAPLKPNHLYTVMIAQGELEDSEIDRQEYFAASGVKFAEPAKPTGTIRQADVVAYANQVIRYAYDYIYPYFPSSENAAINASNAAAILANRAFFTLDRINTPGGLNLSNEVNDIDTAFRFFKSHGSVYKYADDNVAANAADSNNYPLRNDSYTIKFSTFRDFKATLIDPKTATISNINNTILAKEPPRRVAVVVPKNYIKSIETIHYVQGLVPSMQGNNLTNIDITADPDVARVIVTSNRGPRVLINKINNVFTAGYSGLETDGLTEVKIQAFDKYGQILEERNFKLGVNGTNPVKNDYLPKDSNALGKTYTLYDLMADTKLFAEILQHYPVSRLNELGIYLPYTP